MTNEHIGEVIETDSTSFVLELTRGHTVPPLGTLIRVHEAGAVIYGVAAFASIGATEPGRTTTALGMSPEERRREMPHIDALVRTTLRCIVIGYRSDREQYFQRTAPSPAGLHAFAYRAGTEDMRILGEPYDYLRLLVNTARPGIPIDEVIASILQILKGPQRDYREIVAPARVLGQLLQQEPDRLRAILSAAH